MAVWHSESGWGIPDTYLADAGVQAGTGEKSVKQSISPMGQGCTVLSSSSLYEVLCRQSVYQQHCALVGC